MSMQTKVEVERLMSTQNLQALLCFKNHLNVGMEVYSMLLFRPLKVSTADFGKKWGTLAYEKKLKLSVSITATQHFMDAMTSKFNLFPVEIIG